jgi:6,7-dimethyl-8-ribityllumazine synthase
MSHLYKGNLDEKGLTIGIVISRWNAEITDSLRRGAMRELISCGIADESMIVVEVPGAFEIPLACDWLIQHKTMDAIIALSCVIKGDTAHFEYVSDAAMQGIREVSLKHGLPITCGILTTYTEEQALERAGDDENNKGSEAARTAIEMASLRKKMIL